eukprot:3745335-Rhodomonas_salina.1
MQYMPAQDSAWGLGFRAHALGLKVEGSGLGFRGCMLRARERHASEKGQVPRCWDQSQGCKPEG